MLLQETLIINDGFKECGFFLFAGVLIVIALLCVVSTVLVSEKRKKDNNDE